MNRLLIICTTLFSGILGCTSFMNESELYGKYIAEYAFGKEILILNADSTYTQEILISNRSDTIKCAGKWQFISNISGSVYLENAIALHLDGDCDNPEEGSEKPIKGIVSLSISKNSPWSSIELSTGCEGKHMNKVE